MHFTDNKIRLIKPRDKVFELFDDGRTGLGLRVRPSGKKLFTFTTRRNGKLSKMTLGTFGLPEEGKMTLDMAREEIARIRIAQEQGLDPIARRRQNVRLETFYKTIGINENSTVGEVAGAFLKLDAAVNKKDKGKDDSYKLQKYILPRWGNVPMRELKRADIRQLLNEICHDQQKLYQSNRVRALLSKLFNFAIEYEIVEYNPVANIKPFPETAREIYFETDEEIKLFWANLDNTTMSKKMRLCLRLCLVTGQRITEILGMTRGELNLERKEWIVAKNRTKHKKAPHLVPLTDLAVELINEAIKYSPNSDFVFESDNKPNVPIDHTSINKPLRNNLNVFQIPKYWRPHDLRRTVETHMNRLGIDSKIVAHITDHYSEMHIGVSKVYNHYKYEPEKRQAMEIWCKYLQDVTGGPQDNSPLQGNVIDFKPRTNKPK